MIREPEVFVYIAGPYTKPDPAVNTARAMEVWHTLADAGLVPFCPHLSHFLHIARGRPYEEWLAHDIAWLKKCDVLLRMPGESSGADGEVDVANSEGIPVFHSEAEVIEWAESKWDTADYVEA